MLQILISYKREDQDYAEKLRQRLIEWKFDVWMDVYDIPKGIIRDSSEWNSAINKGLQASQVIIGLISPESLESENIRRDWQWAQNNRKNLLFLKLNDFDDSTYRESFSKASYINQVEENTLKESLTQFDRKRTEFLEDILTYAKFDYPPPINEEIQSDLETLRKSLSPPSIKKTIWEFNKFWMALFILAGLVLLLAFLFKETNLASFGAFLGFIASAKPAHNFLPRNVGTQVTKKGEFENYRDILHQHIYQEVENTLKISLKESIALNLNVVIQHDELGDFAIDYGTFNIEEFFNRLKHFLILGEAGAGKTIILLQLATKLLLNTSSKQIPLILNLSSWGHENTPFEDWLIQEAEFVYKIPKKIIEHWLDNDMLFLLLDGLDEIITDETGKNVLPDRIQKINLYRENKETLMVICTRLADYYLAHQDIPEKKLNFSYAIVIEELDKEQIEAYLSKSRDLKGLNQLYVEDEIVQELVKVPFLLVTMANTYQGKTKTQLQEGVLPNRSSRLEHLFDNYTKNQLRLSEYKINEVRPYLEWLAIKTTIFGIIFRTITVTIDWFNDEEKLTKNYHRVLKWSTILIPIILFSLAGYTIAGVTGLLGLGGFGWFLGNTIYRLIFSYGNTYNDVRLIKFSLEALQRNLSYHSKWIILCLVSSFITPLLISLLSLILSTEFIFIGLFIIFTIIFSLFPIYRYYSRKIFVSIRWSGWWVCCLYIFNRAIVYDIWIVAFFSLLITGITIFIVLSAEQGKPMLEIASQEWWGYGAGSILLFLSLFFIFPSVGGWWASIIVVILYLIIGLIPFLLRLAILNYYIQKKLSRRYRKLIQNLKKHQILRAFGGGYTFLHDYMRQSFLHNEKMAFAQLQFLISQLTDGSKRQNIKKAILQFRRDIVIDALISSLLNKDIYTRMAIAQMLEELGWKPQTDEHRKWFAVAKNDFQTLVAFQDVAKLISMFQAGDRRTRGSVVEALGKIGNKEAVDALKKIINHPSWEVRISVVRILGDIEGIKAVDMLIPRLKDGDSRVRMATAIQLGEIGDSRAVKPLIPLLKDESQDSIGFVYKHAEEALRKIGTPEALQALRDAGFDTE
jgi:hypothetical protein